ncbi:unnamed protein product [Withania somnifera]
MNVNKKLISDDGTGLMDARCFTRPDIAFSISAVSGFMHNPTKHHLGVVKRILRYVAGTTNYGIRWCPDDRKSTSRYVFSLGSGVISWSSNKQEIVAFSSSEAEYIAAIVSSCQAVWLKRLLADVFQEQAAATEIFCDNKATIAMTKNPAFHRRTKHIDIRYHFIRDLIKSGSIVLKHCGTNQ